MNWQPISTAPKDELILVARTKRMCGPCAAMNSSQDGWVTETPGEWVSIYTPEHWMPLPAAPAAECRTCSGHGAVGNILTAEPCPDCTPAPAASARQVLTDSQILHLQETHVGGPAPSYPIDAADWLNFGRAVEYAALATLAAKESP